MHGQTTFSVFVCGGGKKGLEQFTGDNGVYTLTSVNCLMSHYKGNTRLLLKKIMFLLLTLPVGQGELTPVAPVNCSRPFFLPPKEKRKKAVWPHETNSLVGMSST